MTQQIKKIKTTDNLNKIENNHLSIQFSLDGFSFCVLNKDSKTFTKLYSSLFSEQQKTPQALLKNVAEIVKEEKTLLNKYNSITISHVNDLATFVPSHLFDKDKLSWYVEYTNKIFQSDFFVYDELKDYNIINVFAPYVNINNFFIDNFGEFEYRHYSGVLVDNLLKTYKQSIEPRMFVNVNRSHFEIVIIKDKKFQFYNTFKYSTKEDFIYYILFTTEQLKLDPKKIDLQLLGYVDKDDELFKITYTYIQNVSLLENRSEYSFDSSITETEKRKHYTLLHQH